MRRARWLAAVALLGAAALVPFVEKKPAIGWYRGFPVSEGRRAATPGGEKLEVSLGSPIFARGPLRRLLAKKDARVAAADALIEAEALDAGWVELMKDNIYGDNYERVYARASDRVDEVRAFFPGTGDTMMFRFFERPLPLFYRAFPVPRADAGYTQAEFEGGERLTIAGNCDDTEEPSIWGWKRGRALRDPHAVGFVRGEVHVDVKDVGDGCALSFFPPAQNP